MAFFKIFPSLYFNVILLGFLQEASNGISMVAIQYLYKDEFHLDPSGASFLDSLSTIPWIIKPLWGFISDSFHFFGYRRKSYLILFSFIQILSWCLLSTFTGNIYVGIGCLLMLSFAGAFINVICEALLVEITQANSAVKSEEEKQTEASKNVSSYFGARYFGTFFTVFLGGLLLDKLNKKITFAISASFCFLSGLSSFFLCEIRRKNNTETKKKEEKDSIQNNDLQNEETLKLNPKDEGKISETLEEKKEKSTLHLLLIFFRQKEILFPVCFIFLLAVRPSSNLAIFYFYTIELAFTAEFVGVLQLIHSLGSIIGVYFYNRYCKFVSFKRFFITTTLIYVCLDLSQIILVKRFNKSLGIPDQVFCVIDSLITDFLMELNMFPLLIIACRLSPKNIEGTMYALMMSIYNFSSMLGGQIGGLAMRFLNITENDFGKLHLLIIFTNVWVVSILPFIYFADFQGAQKMADGEKNDVKEKINGEENHIDEEAHEKTKNLIETSIIKK